MLTEHDSETFDLAFALSQFSGNHTLLIKILGTFVEQNENFAAELTASLQSNDLDTAKRQVHTLKGVTGNLGMKALHQACKELEEQLSSETCRESLENFFDLVSDTVDIAKNYGDEPQSPAASSTPVTSVTPVSAESSSDKEKLITALQRNEFLSDAKLEQYLQSLALSPQDNQQLKQFIDDFNYASAISMLNC